MADEDQDSKTEEATPKRLEQARGEGNVPQSQEIKTWAALLAGTVVVLFLSPWMASRLTSYLADFVANAHTYRLDLNSLRVLVMEIGLQVAAILWAPILLLVIMAVGSGYAQYGWLWTPKKLQPKLSNISPIAGFKRQFSMRQVVELIKGIFKIVVIGLALYITIWPRHDEAELLLPLTVGLQLVYLLDLLRILLITVLVVVLAMAIADLVYQRHAFAKQMRMTKQDVRDEHKNAEGDPQVKGRIRSLRIQRSRERMMQAVPHADVVVTNPTHYAVALKYDMATMAAPVLVAKGVDHLALQIRRVAEENGVPIVENPPLARTLYATVDLDREIRPEQYKAVAEIIGYVMRLKKKFSPAG